MCMRIRSPWPGAPVEVVDGRRPDRVIVPATSEATFSLDADRVGEYLVQRPSAPTAALPHAAVTGTSAAHARHLAGSTAQIGLHPPGVGAPAAMPDPDREHAHGLGPDERPYSPGLVHVRPLRELAGRSDLPGHRSGSSASLDAGRFLGTAQTTLGFLREATFATEVKVNPTDDFRRLWDWKIRGGGDGDGFLIDLTSAGNVRFIASGRNVTTDAVLPTGGAAVRRRPGRRPADQRRARPNAIFPRVLSATDVTRWQALALGG